VKIYTRTGDRGDTGLFGGGRVRKDHERVRAYGTVDEANSAIGMAAAAPDLPRDLHGPLLEIMSDLFDVGAELATPHDASAALSARLVTRVDASRVTELEHAIDAVDAEVVPLAAFVLPTGSDAAARLHMARTAVRRAEREVVTLLVDEPVRAEVLTYLNRLSDLLFAWSRLANARAGVGDVPWRPRKDAGAPKKSE
jgi:cob(I)alamin adenosyltransferase